jgi:hypothetical protein
MDHLSAYERERLEQILKNKAVLEGLGLGGAAMGLPPRARVKRPPAPPRPPLEPTRRSSRLEGGQAPGVYVAEEGALGAVTLGGNVEHAAEWLRGSGAEKRTLPGSAPADQPPITYMPEGPDDLLPEEQAAFVAVRAAKAAKARELDTAGYNVAQLRALCELVRRTPTTLEGLEECWGFGPAKCANYGPLFLDTLAPFIPKLREAQEAAHVAAARWGEEPGKTVGNTGGGEDCDVKVAGGDRDGTVAAARRRLREATEGEGGAEGRVKDVEEEVMDAEDEEGEDGGPASATRVLDARLGKAWAESLPLPTSPDDLFQHEIPAFESLREWKRSRARELGFNDPCVICHNRTLCEVVRLLPSSLEQLLKVWGMGPKRLAQHGSLMLEALEPLRAGLLEARRRQAGLESSRAPESVNLREGKPGFAGSSSVASPNMVSAGHQSPSAGGGGGGDAAGGVGEGSAPMPSGLQRSRRASRASAGGRRVGRRGGESSAGTQPATVPGAPPEIEISTEIETPPEIAPEIGIEPEIATVDADGFPCGPWLYRRQWCASYNHCDACAGYVDLGERYKWAPMSQTVLNMLASPRAYGSHAAAQAAGWRWGVRPNGLSRSHTHSWWPPQGAMDDLAAINGGEVPALPIGTTKAKQLVGAMFG